MWQDSRNLQPSLSRDVGLKIGFSEVNLEPNGMKPLEWWNDLVTVLQHALLCSRSQFAARASFGQITQDSSP